jgi:hypothetical protein
VKIWFVFALPCWTPLPGLKMEAAVTVPSEFVAGGQTPLPVK